MSKSATERAREFYALTYDASVSDWPGEIDFYREMAQETVTKDHAVLEVACGTGRVTLRLAQDGVAVVGLDISPAMLEVARAKSRGLDHVSWVQGDLRSFDLGQTFGLVLIPGHAFQNLLIAVDQVACLKTIRRHLAPGGVLVVHLDHQDVRWLGNLREEEGGVFYEAESFRHRSTGREIRTNRAWSYEPATQTAIAHTIWEEMGADGQVVERWESGPIRFHCLFPLEMKHLCRINLEASPCPRCKRREPRNPKRFCWQSFQRSGKRSSNEPRFNTN